MEYNRNNTIYDLAVHTLQYPKSIGGFPLYRGEEGVAGILFWQTTYAQLNAQFCTPHPKALEDPLLLMQAILKAIKEILGSTPPSAAWCRQHVEPYLTGKMLFYYDQIRGARESTLQLALEYRAEQHVNRNQSEQAAFRSQFLRMAQRISMTASARYNSEEAHMLELPPEYACSSKVAGTSSRTILSTPGGSSAGTRQSPISEAEAAAKLGKLVKEIKAEYKAEGKMVPSMEVLKAVAAERVKHLQRGSEGDSAAAATPLSAAASQQAPHRVMTRAAAMTLAKQLGWQIPTSYREAHEFAGLSPHYYLYREAPGEPVEVTLANAGILLLTDFKDLFNEQYCRYTTRTCQQMWDATSYGVNLDGKLITGDTFRALLERLKLFLQLKSTDRVAFDEPKMLDKLRNCIYAHPNIGHDMRDFIKTPDGRDMDADQVADEADIRVKFFDAQQQQGEGLHSHSAKEMKPSQVQKFLQDVSHKTRQAFLSQLVNSQQADGHSKGGQHGNGGGQRGAGTSSHGGGDSRSSQQHPPPSQQLQPRRSEANPPHNRVAHGAAQGDEATASRGLRQPPGPDQRCGVCNSPEHFARACPNRYRTGEHQGYADGHRDPGTVAVSQSRQGQSDRPGVPNQSNRAESRERGRPAPPVQQQRVAFAGVQHNVPHRGSRTGWDVPDDEPRDDDE